MGGGRLGPPLQVGPPQLPQGCALLWAGLSACRCRGRPGSEVWGLPYSPRLWVLLGWGVVLESQGVSHHSVDPDGQLTVHRHRSGPNMGTCSGKKRQADIVTHTGGHVCPRGPRTAPWGAQQGGTPLLERRHVW